MITGIFCSILHEIFFTQFDTAQEYDFSQVMLNLKSHEYAFFVYNTVKLTFLSFWGQLIRWPLLLRRAVLKRDCCHLLKTANEVVKISLLFKWILGTNWDWFYFTWFSSPGRWIWWLRCSFFHTVVIAGRGISSTFQSWERRFGMRHGLLLGWVGAKFKIIP